MTPTGRLALISEWLRSRLPFWVAISAATLVLLAVVSGLAFVALRMARVDTVEQQMNVLRTEREHDMKETQAQINALAERVHDLEQTVYASLEPRVRKGPALPPRDRAAITRGELNQIITTLQKRLLRLENEK